LVDAIIYGRDLGQDDDFVSEERFDKIRFYLKNGKYPNGADRAEKSRLRSAATHYKLTPGKDDEPEKLWLKGKEVIADPQKQYEIARDIHHKSHGGINKTTAAIAELYHWVRIKETVSQVIRNCPECSEMNKGLSIMRNNPNQNQPRYNTSSNGQSQSPMTSTPPVDMYAHLRPSPPPSQDSADDQLHLEAAQQQEPFPHYPQHDDFDMPVDPALMEGIQSNTRLPSPFLAAGQGSNGVRNVGELESESPGPHPSEGSERAPTAREEIRRRLNRVASYGQT
jgi:hypothetical protein